jgi:tetratricopeptide (TPR) repeat protein/tRNA A-37 threonylcarbamoyl transferase component Bud32
LTDVLARAAEGSALQRLAVLRADQHRRWRQGQRLPVETYLERMPAVRDDGEAVLDLVYSEVLLREEAGERPQLEEYLRRFPALEASLRLQFDLHRAVASGLSLGPGADGAATPPLPADDGPGEAPRAKPESRNGTPGASLSTQVAGDANRETMKSRSAAPALTAIPGYEVLEVLGRGGMNVVYKARHTALKRVVALKMILAGEHASAAERARFKSEAEAVARLQHPNIIQVHEIGEHEGKPFITLEFCSGGALDKKLNGAPLPPAEAARLVETLARAVHAAHEHDVVHRDLKPANVLLAADGSPKITDFGLARKLDEVGRTQTGQVMGTPSYMAPEQAAGRTKEIGRAVDVYALGAILYECLTGRPPFRGPTALDTLHQVLTDDPAPPRRLQSKTPRDLETVCLKCLEKAPARRYATALELAEDLRRFRAGEPVRARPVGAPERAWKWARSHAALVGVIAAAAAVVLGSTAIAFVLIAQSRDDAIRAKNAAVAKAAENEQLATNERAARRDAQTAQKRAEDEADEANAVTSFLAGTFKASDPLGIDCADLYIPKQWGEKLTAQELLERGEKKCRVDLRDRPAVQAKVLDTIGAVYLAQAKFKDALRVLEDSRAIRERTSDVNPLDEAANLHNLGRLAHYLGQYDKADPLYRKALDIRRERLGAHDQLVADTMLNLAWLLSEADEPVEAEKTFREVIALRRQEPGGDDRRDVAIAKFGLVAFFLDQGDPRNAAEAATLAAEAIGVFVKLEGDKNVGKAVGLFQTALLIRAVSPRIAEDRLRECLALTRQAIGDRTVYVALILHELALTLEEENKDEEADKDFAECLDVLRELVGLEHPKAIVVIDNYASLLARRGKRDQADKLYQELLAAQKERFGENHFFVANVLADYADFLARRDDARCERMLREALDIYRESGGPRRRYYTRTLARLGDVCLRGKRDAEAEQAYRDALPLTRKQFGEASEATAYVEDRLAAAVLRQGHVTNEVEQLLASAAETYEQAPGQKSSDLMATLDDLGQYYRAVGRAGDAAAAALRRRQYGANDPNQLFAAACDLAMCIPLVGQETSQPTADQEAERAKYADEAVATLKQALDQGFKNQKRLKESDALAVLRSRADFQALEKRLEIANEPRP